MLYKPEGWVSSQFIPSYPHYQNLQVTNPHPDKTACVPALPVSCRLLASAYYHKKLCLLCDGEDKATTEVHKSIPALCLRLDGGIKMAKPSFSLSLSRLFRKMPSCLLLNPLVRPPGRRDGCIPHLVTESRPGGAFAAGCDVRGKQICARWKPWALETRGHPRGRVGRDALCPWGTLHCAPHPGGSPAMSRGGSI